MRFFWQFCGCIFAMMMEKQPTPENMFIIVSPGKTFFSNTHSLIRKTRREENVLRIYFKYATALFMRGFHIFIPPKSLLNPLFGITHLYRHEESILSCGLQLSFPNSLLTISHSRFPCTLAILHFSICTLHLNA